MGLISYAVIAPKGKLNAEDLKKMGMNLIVFTAPALAVFFGLLATGVPFEKAWPAGLLALYGPIADFFKKLQTK